MRNLDEEFAGLIEHGLNDRVVHSRAVDRRTQSLYSGRVFKSHRNNCSAFEVDAEVESIGAIGVEFMTVERSAHSRQHQGNGQADEEPAFAQPVDLYIMK